MSNSKPDQLVLGKTSLALRNSVGAFAVAGRMLKHLPPLAIDQVPVNLLQVVGGCSDHATAQHIPRIYDGCLRDNDFRNNAKQIPVFTK